MHESIEMSTYYDDMYSCLNAGHQESIDKAKEIGKDDINQHGIYMKFICLEKKEIIFAKVNLYSCTLHSRLYKL